MKGGDIYMYSFLLNMWIMQRITKTNLDNAVTKGYITQAEEDMILATPQGPPMAATEDK